jgi:hypothetical protein
MTLHGGNEGEPSSAEATPNKTSTRFGQRSRIAVSSGVTSPFVGLVAANDEAM